MTKTLCRNLVLLTLCMFALALTSCSEDSAKLVLPVYEISVPQEMHAGERVKVDLVNKNNPNNQRYNNYAWSAEDDALVWESANTAGGTGRTMTNYFNASAPGKYTLKVVVDMSNFADGNAADTGKTVKSGETTTTYTSVSTLKTTVTVTRTIVVNK